MSGGVSGPYLAHLWAPQMSEARAAARYSRGCPDIEDIVVCLWEHADMEHLERLEYPKIQSEIILGLCGYL